MSLTEPPAGASCRTRVAAAAREIGVHHGLFEVRAGAVVRAMLEEQLGPDAATCSAAIDLLVRAVEDGAAADVTGGPIPGATFDRCVDRLRRAAELSPGEARWALATWAAVAREGREGAVVVSSASGEGEDGPGEDEAAVATSSARSRLPLLAAAAGALVVLAVVLVVLVGRNGDDESGGVAAPPPTVGAVTATGPFESGEEFLTNLPAIDGFTRVEPTGMAAATAEYEVTDDFAVACALLGQALQTMDPEFPVLAEVPYPNGEGVNRCEAQAPVAALDGRSVRALVLTAGNRAQIYVEGATVEPSTSAPPP